MMDNQYNRDTFEVTGRQGVFEAVDVRKNMVNTRCSLFFRLSPQEWESAHPCESDPDELENGLNLLNCLWHNIGALMQQGSDLAPK